jgi:hypothetical protein
MSTRAPEPAGAGRAVTAFPDAGFFLLRSFDSYCLIDCGDVGLRGRGGHGHNDALSVELVLADRDVLVDTGCASYTRLIDERVACLSARAHNSVVVDEIEPAPIDLARIPHASPCPVELVALDEQGCAFVGRHTGYRGRIAVDSCERRVELLRDRPAAVITDRITGSGSHSVRWHFHLGEEWLPSDRAADRARFDSGAADGGVLEVVWSLPGATVAVERTALYPAYAKKASRWCLQLTATVTLPLVVEFRFLLRSRRS